MNYANNITLSKIGKRLRINKWNCINAQKVLKTLPHTDIIEDKKVELLYQNLADERSKEDNSKKSEIASNGAKDQCKVKASSMKCGSKVELTENEQQESVSKPLFPSNEDSCKELVNDKKSLESKKENNSHDLDPKLIQSKRNAFNSKDDINYLTIKNSSKSKGKSPSSNNTESHSKSVIENSNTYSSNEDLVIISSHNSINNCKNNKKFIKKNKTSPFADIMDNTIAKYLAGNTQPLIQIKHKLLIHPAKQRENIARIVKRHPLINNRIADSIIELSDSHILHMESINSKI